MKSSLKVQLIDGIIDLNVVLVGSEFEAGLFHQKVFDCKLRKSYCRDM